MPKDYFRKSRHSIPREGGSCAPARSEPQGVVSPYLTFFWSADSAAGGYTRIRKENISFALFDAAIGL